MHHTAATDTGVSASSSASDENGNNTLSPFAVGLIILAFAVGSFGIGTGEFAIMGLLPDVAATFGVSLPQAGHVISAYALGVVVGAPLITIAAARMPRRTLLLLMMAIFAVGNLLSAAAPDYYSFIALRFITGLPHGAYFGVAALLAASMVPVHRRTRAVGMVMLGLTLATLAGTPLATLIGQHLNWRSAFVMVGFNGAITVGLIWYFLPGDTVRPTASPLQELASLARPQVLLTLSLAAFGYGGLFAVYSYIAPTATEVAGMHPSMIAVLVALFGIGMNIGNLFGSWCSDRSLMGTLGVTLVFNVIVLSLFSLTASNPVMLCLTTLLVGCGTAANTGMQTRLMDVAGEAKTLAAASHHSAFNIANAMGAWLGGLAISWGYGYASTGFIGAILSIFGLGIFSLSLYLEKRHPA